MVHMIMQVFFGHIYIEYIANFCTGKAKCTALE